MLKTSKRHREPIPGYRLLEPLGRGGFGEVWKCEAPGGLFKAIKFIEGHHNLVHDHAAPALEELQAIQHIKSLRHPFLLSIERVEWVRGELAIVMELADRSLMDVFHDYVNKGAPGIPRDELLRYLHEAADVLDLLNQQHGLQHLDIKPGNLFLISNHLKVADFGLVRSLTGARTAAGERPTAGTGDAAKHLSATTTRIVGGLTARYAAPELFHNAISSSCDQYSLAIVYQELLTGVRPFHGKNARQLMIQHCTATPDASALSEPDRAVVARALAKEPGQRFPTCTAFVQALKTSGKPSRDTTAGMETIRALAEFHLDWGERKEWPGCPSPQSETPRPSEHRAGVCALVAELMVEARGERSVLQADHSQVALPSSGVFEGRFPARLAAGNAFASLETFRRQWNARVIRATDCSIVFQIPFPGRFWERWLDGTRGVLVEVHWIQPRRGGTTLPEFVVRTRCADKKNKEEQKLVCDIGPLVLDSLRSHLEACPERRMQERVDWPYPVRATFLFADNQASETMEGKGKDLSLGGMGLYLPRAIAGTPVQLELRRPSHEEPIVFYGNCVRVQLCSDGWFETGVLF